MATIQIPTPLRKFTNNTSKYETDKATVAEAIQDLTVTYPDLKQNLLDEDGHIRSFVNVFVDETNIKSLEKEQTPVKPDQTINLIPAIAGGLGFF
jgi:molybdopterin converting factor small subunit